MYQKEKLADKEKQTMSDQEMLKNWLKGKEEKAYEEGIKYACETLFHSCECYSTPALMSYGDDTFYVSMDEIHGEVNRILQINKINLRL